MLTDRIIFARLMALLRSIDPSVPLPANLEPELWARMMEEGLYKKGMVLEERAEKHNKAYYVVTGFVIVFCFDAAGDKHVYRIYRKNTIVALDSFMYQTESEYMVWVCKDAVLLSISRKHMRALYGLIPGVELMAEKTASKFKTAKERLRFGFLNLPDEIRVMKLYKDFEGLLPVRRSPIRDNELAEFVDMSLVRFRRVRKKLFSARAAMR